MGTANCPVQISLHCFISLYALDSFVNPFDVMVQVSKAGISNAWAKFAGLRFNIIVGMHVVAKIILSKRIP